MITGTCLCGAVTLSAPGTPGPVTACHCTQCRKLSGFYAASIDIAEGQTTWTGTDAIQTYTTPGGATRAFCATCGTKLWFRAPDGAFSIEAGLLDQPTHTTMTAHIFTADKGDYYQIADGLPQYAAEGPD
jgi:hypothetical protein